MLTSNKKFVKLYKLAKEGQKLKKMIDEDEVMDVETWDELEEAEAAMCEYAHESVGYPLPLGAAAEEDNFSELHPSEDDYVPETLRDEYRALCTVYEDCDRMMSFCFQRLNEIESKGLAKTRLAGVTKTFSKILSDSLSQYR